MPLHAKDRRDREYWISPDGAVIKYTGDEDMEDIYSLHGMIADQLFPNGKGTDALFKLGYICVGSTVYSNPYSTKKPTTRQLATLERLQLLKYFCVEYEGYHQPYERYLQMIYEK